MYAVEVADIEGRQMLFGQHSLFAEEERCEYGAELGGSSSDTVPECLRARGLPAAIDTVIAMSGLDGLLSAEGWAEVLSGDNNALLAAIREHTCFPSDMHRQWLEWLAEAFADKTALSPVLIVRLQILGTMDGLEFPASFDDKAAATCWAARLVRDAGASEDLFTDERLADEDGCASVILHAQFLELEDPSPDTDEFGSAVLELALLPESAEGLTEGAEFESEATFD